MHATRRVFMGQGRKMSTSPLRRKLRNEGTLAILGGVGPMAGVKFHEKIVRNTISQCDQDHLEVLHFSRSEDITPRDTFLPGQDQDEITFNDTDDLEEIENPAFGMLRSVEILDMYSRTRKRDVIIGIPCITFHTPSIWEEFQRGVDNLNANNKDNELAVFHLVHETVKAIQEFFPDVKKLGILSTLTTRNAKIMSQPFVDHGIEVVQVPMEYQNKVANVIHNPSHGIKVMYPPNYRVKEELHECVIQLKEMGAEAVLLGCSELPIALDDSVIYGVPLIDPTLVLARSMIERANASKLTNDCPFVETIERFGRAHEFLKYEKVLNGVHAVQKGNLHEMVAKE